MASTRELKFTRFFFAVSVICSIVLSLILGIRANDPVWLSISSGLILVLVVSWFFMSHLHRRQKNIGLFLTLGIINLLLVAPELGLRVAADFRYQSGVWQKRDFAYPEQRHFFWRIIPDDKLFWKYSPDEPGINSWGFRGKEIEVQKPSNVFRIVFLGDSCTEQGYPAMVEEFLNQKYGNAHRRFECVSLAVAGYSSHQGKVVAELYGSKLQPDLAVVCFGWNDHWLAWTSIDSKKIVRVSQTFLEKAIDLPYRQFQLLQFLNWLLVPHPNYAGKLSEMRVPEDDYRENLTSMAEIFARIDCPVVFLTAPTSAYRLGFGYNYPSFSVSEEAVTDLHKRYNKIVRAVAKERGACLLDLETDFDALENVGSLFSEDKIHFTNDGIKVMAHKVSDFVSADVLHLDKRN
jgi:lysophospholipase L1-like esterase